MAIYKLSTTDLPKDNGLDAQPPNNTPSKEPTDPQDSNLTCTPNPIKTQTHSEVIGVHNTEGKVYGNATGLYHKHHKYSELWNPWHPCWFAHDFQQTL